MPGIPAWNTDGGYYPGDGTGPFYPGDTGYVAPPDDNNDDENNNDNKNQMTPAALRQKAKDEGWQEDFERFTDGQLQKWIDKYWDPAKGRFKSQHQGVDGWFDKPTDCPEGQVPVGAAENAPCAPTSDFDPVTGFYKGGGGGAGTPADDGIIEAPATPKTEAQNLQEALVRKFQDRKSIFGFKDSRNPSSGLADTLFGKELNSGGLWWGTDKSMFDKTGGGGGGGGGSADDLSAAMLIPEDQRLPTNMPHDGSGVPWDEEPPTDPLSRALWLQNKRSRQEYGV